MPHLAGDLFGTAPPCQRSVFPADSSLTARHSPTAAEMWPLDGSKVGFLEAKFDTVNGDFVKHQKPVFDSVAPAAYGD